MGFQGTSAMRERTQTEPVHRHDWELDTRLPAQFDTTSETLTVYENCEGTAHPSGLREHVLCTSTRRTRFALKYIEREDGTRVESTDVNRDEIIDMVAERIHEGRVVEKWWEPYGGVDTAEKTVHVYAGEADWYAVFQFDERSVDGGR